MKQLFHNFILYFLCSTFSAKAVVPLVHVMSRRQKTDRQSRTQRAWRVRPNHRRTRLHSQDVKVRAQHPRTCVTHAPEPPSRPRFLPAPASSWLLPRLRPPPPPPQPPRPPRPPRLQRNSHSREQGRKEGMPAGRTLRGRRGHRGPRPARRRSAAL